jgi:hypothetical protein
MSAWYISIAAFVYCWINEIDHCLFVFGVYRDLFLVSISWLVHCGTKYYIYRYRYATDEEDKWRVVEFPPIR